MASNDKGDRWPPKKNDMPDLSALCCTLSVGLTLSAFFRRAGPVDPQARALWKNYVRLVDHLVWEYNIARQSLQEYIDTPNGTISPLFRCTAHMESCINTMRRAIRFASRMRNHKDSPPINKLAILSDSVGDRLRTTRNAIEHLECDILKGKICDGEPTTLLVHSDRIALLGNEILYSEFADWITELHKLAESLVDYHPPSGSA